jgi:hypothetical protein
MKKEEGGLDSDVGNYKNGILLDRKVIGDRIRYKSLLKKRLKKEDDEGGA